MKLDLLHPNVVGKRIAAIAVSGNLASQVQRSERGAHKRLERMRTRQKDFSRQHGNRDTYFGGVSKETRFIDTYTKLLRQSNFTLLFECPVDWKLINEQMDPTEEQAGKWKGYIRRTQGWVASANGPHGEEHSTTAEELDAQIAAKNDAQVLHKTLFAGTLKCIDFDDPALIQAWTEGNDINRADSMALRVQQCPNSVIALFLGQEWSVQQAAKLFGTEPVLPLLGAVVGPQWLGDLEKALEHLQSPKGENGADTGSVALANLLRRLGQYGLTQTGHGLGDCLYLSGTGYSEW